MRLNIVHTELILAKQDQGCGKVRHQALISGVEDYRVQAAANGDMATPRAAIRTTAGRICLDIEALLQT